MRGALLPALLVAVAGCQATLPQYSVNIPPRWSDIRPAPSLVFVDGDVPLTALSTALEAALPKEFASASSNQHAAASYHLVRRPSVVHAVDRGLELILAADGEVTFGLGVMRCGGQGIGIAITVRSRPTLANNELQLFAEPKLTTKVTGDLRCMGAPVPLEPILSPVLAIFAKGIELALGKARIPIDPLLHKALAELATPRALTVAGNAVCLDLAPSAFVIAPIGGDGDHLTIKLGAEVAPRLKLGECPTAPASIPAAVMAREVSLGDAFAVDAIVAITHAELATRLTRALIGKRFGSHGQFIEVRSVDVADANGRVLVRLGVIGAFVGTLNLWGTPQLDERGGRFVVTFPDLQVALETRSAVQRLKLALWALVDGGLPVAVREKLDLDISDRIAQARIAIVRAWDRPLAAGFALHVTIDALELGAVVSSPGILAAHVTLRGNASLYRP